MFDFDRCIYETTKRNFFDPVTFMVQNYYSLDPKKAASKRLNFIRVIEGESAARNAIEYIKN